MRPKFHFTPAQNWINDPNGLIFHKGEYHLFYQHNPLGNQWGHMSWGHAKSSDLLNWQHLPMAIPEQSTYAIFSGSAVFDEANNRLVAIYTAHQEQNQSQHLAFSYDDGLTWQQYDANPVLDIDYVDFRDPKVFRYQDHWIMAVVKPWEEVVCFYKSNDLITWQFLSEFGESKKDDIQWECPDLFYLDGKWVLLISENHPERIGACKMRYYVGAFDGKVFTPEHARHKVLDYGPDFYAGVTFNNTPENSRIMIGWFNNWAYAKKDKFAIEANWNGSMSVARKLSLKDGLLHQEFLAPIKEFQIESGVDKFVLRYPEGDLIFTRSETHIEISRAELWEDELTIANIPIGKKDALTLKCVFDVGSIELTLKGHTYSSRLRVGETPPSLHV